MSENLITELRKTCKGLDELDAEDIVQSLLSQVNEMIAAGRGFKDLTLSTNEKTGVFVRDVLRRYRDRARRKQKDVAAELEWSTSTLIRIERNQGGISLPQLNELIQLYKIPPHLANELRARRKER